MYLPFFPQTHKYAHTHGYPKFERSIFASYNYVLQALGLAQTNQLHYFVMQYLVREKKKVLKTMLQGALTSVEDVETYIE